MVCVIFITAFIVPATGIADVRGVLTRTDRDYQCKDIRYIASQKLYRCKLLNGAKLDIPVNQVAKKRIAAPAELKELLARVDKDDFKGVETLLKKIIKDYAMLDHDIPAAEALSKVYLKTDREKEAVSLCETISRNYGLKAMSGEFTEIYVNALAASGQPGKLNNLYEEAIRNGSRQAAAAAQVKRSDILMKKDNFKEALVDGYLRTVVLFRDVENVQPRALYQAMECFKKLGQATYAEKMRRKLVNEYSNSEYALKVI
jgi:hypothetical protein